MLSEHLHRACAVLAVIAGLVAIGLQKAAVAADGGPTAAAPAQVAQSGPVPQRAVWRVVALAGEARMRPPGGSFTELHVGDAVTVGNEVVTGLESELVLERAKDRMTMSGATWVQLAPPQPGGLLDRFIQTIGSILYDVEPRGDPSFGVEAPYVAAVVKGTRFTVDAGTRMSSVHVERGKVQVISRDGAGELLVEAGQTASASPGRFRGLRLSSLDAPVDGISVDAPQAVADAVEPDNATGAHHAAGTGSGGARGTLGAGEARGGTADRTGSLNGAGSGAGQAGGLGGAVSDTGSALGNTADKAGDLADRTADALGGTVGALGNGLGGALGGPVGGLVGDTTGAVGGVLNKAGDVADNAVDAVGGVVGGAGKALGGLLGGRRRDRK